LDFGKLTWESSLVPRQVGSITEPLSNAELFHNQFRRQVLCVAQFGMALQVGFQKGALSAPPAHLQIGLDEFVERRQPESIAGRWEEFVNGYILTLLPAVLEPTGATLETIPVVVPQGSNIIGGHD
jgi:hypothetical protein